MVIWQLAQNHWTVWSLSLYCISVCLQTHFLKGWDVQNRNQIECNDLQISQVEGNKYIQCLF